SLLAELTPSTHTWSRLKAALSIHRKGTSLNCLNVYLLSFPFVIQLVFDHDEMSDAEKVYAECGQEGPVAWDECLLPQRMKQCVKIGEGTFGEVFSTTSGKSNGEIVALKVIPVEGSEKVNGEDQKTFGEILHEIIISKELSCLDKKEKNQTSGFIGLRDLHCVKGCYPPEFLHAWDKFDKQKHSENDRPDFFENEQLFIILEFEFGGTDLENSNGTLSSIAVAKSILHQVTAALAVAEQELQFEHRDLHWGNVLVKVTKQKTAEFILNGTVHSLDTKGVLVRIIDYSLSRLEIGQKSFCLLHMTISLFIGQGDYQFEIYRLMRQENGNEWSSYNPHSNVLWLHYLCSKLLDMKYRGSGGKRNKDIRGELASFYDNVLQFSSATEVLQNSLLFQ
uniref:Serine/threonine-protein kinase haspin n=1 Tax=Periophthalmus magnuspinnatus TaxID=409849 RepID=A0A3B4B1M2_9GOBI